ncbi:MAG: amidase, partial [Arenicellales bacterium]
MHQKSIAEHANSLAKGEYSSVELTEHFLKRIESNSDLNAFITVTDQLAREQATQADQLIKAGKAGLLTGIPIAQKDLLCAKGVLTTCGSRILENFISPYDATVITKLHEQGMVTLGKTNMDEFAMGSSNETSFYGPVKNPWDLE